MGERSVRRARRGGGEDERFRPMMEPARVETATLWSNTSSVALQVKASYVVERQRNSRGERERDRPTY